MIFATRWGKQFNIDFYYNLMIELLGKNRTMMRFLLLLSEHAFLHLSIF